MSNVNNANPAAKGGWSNNFWIYRWLCFGILSVAYVLAQFHRNAMAVVASDMMLDLSMTGAGIGLLASGYFYAYGGMQIPGGFVTDYWGPRKTASMFFALGAVGTIILGLAPVPWVAVLGRVMIGLGVAIVFVPAMKIFSYWFRQSEFSILAGFFMAAGGAGALLASAPLTLMNSLMGWRGSFIAIGVVSLLAAGGLWLILRDTPEQKGFNSAELLGEGHTASAKPLPFKQAFKVIISNRSFWLLCCANFLNFGVSYAFVSLWCGPYFKQIYGYSAGRIGTFLTLFAIFMIIGSFLISRISNRLHSRKKVLLFSFAVSFLMMLMIALFPQNLPVAAFYLMFVLIGLVSHPITAIFATCANEMFPKNVNGAATGLINTFSFIGGGLAQIFMGRFLDWYSGGGTGGVYDVKTYAASFALLTVAMAVAFLVTLPVKEPYRG